MKQEELLESLALGICEEAMGAVNKHKVKKGDRDEMKRLSLQVFFAFAFLFLTFNYTWFEI